MKTNSNKTSINNKPIYIRSVFYPDNGYVAIPEKRSQEIKERKYIKPLKNFEQEGGGVIEMIKQSLGCITSNWKNKEKRVS
jgi:hypothetical protein